MTGDCFESAGRQIMDIPPISKARLCHGTVTGQGPAAGRRFIHAWIELGDVVFDNSNGKEITMDRQAYYHVGDITGVTRYTQDEACRLMVETSNFGPWREST